jgi:hypothetical protein
VILLQGSTFADQYVLGPLWLTQCELLRGSSGEGILQQSVDAVVPVERRCNRKLSGDATAVRQVLSLLGREGNGTE